MSTPINNKTILSLQGLTCMHCVGSVTKVLEARSDVEKVKVTLDYAVIEGEASQDELIKTIIDDGYEAFATSKPDTELALSGLSCMNCAGKTQKALEAIDGVAAAIVDTQYAAVYGKVDSQLLIDAIKAAGFDAELKADSTTVLALSGLNCMKCAAKTQKALEAVDGVVSAKVDTETAKVQGRASAENLIAAVVAIGFEAQIAENDTAPK